MKKHQILYKWPIAQINRLCDSPDADLFADSLKAKDLDVFVELTEQMRGFVAGLAKAKRKRQLFQQWGDLGGCLEKFEQQFSGFPNFDPEKFRLSLLLEAKLVVSARPVAAGAPDLDDAEVNENLFELRSLLAPLPISWFVRQNAQSFSDSIVVFSCSDVHTKEKQKLIMDSNISPELLLQLLAALHTSTQVPMPQAALVKTRSPSIENEAVDAFARLVILASGRPVHLPRCYTPPPSVIDRDCFRAGTPYHQLNDVFNVLSEYNSRQEILTKYLTLYHVIENFMFKLPIVDLERQQGGRMFSIRDFRRLYKQIDDSEMSAIKRLFIATFQLQATPVTSFEQQVVARWDSLVQRTGPADIENALGALDLKKEKRAMTCAEFKAGEVAGHFAQMVYAIRNAIVHNKETEFHLTYATLDNTICTLIESFVIPCLEEMCFALVGSPNQHVWYLNKQLLLYK